MARWSFRAIKKKKKRAGQLELYTWPTSGQAFPPPRPSFFLPVILSSLFSFSFFSPLFLWQVTVDYVPITGKQQVPVNRDAWASEGGRQHSCSKMTADVASRRCVEHLGCELPSHFLANFDDFSG